MSVFLLSKLPILKKVYFAKCSSQPKIHFATGGKMYYLTVENSFDSAHFLHGYEGKCKRDYGLL